VGGGGGGGLGVGGGGVGFGGLGVGVWGLGAGGLGFGVWGSGFRVDQAVFFSFSRLLLSGPGATLETRDRLSGRGTTRAEYAQETPTQSHI